MSNRAKDLAQRIEAFNNEVITFVENCSEEDWRKMCSWEEWSVGVTARHIGAGHYEAVDLVKMIVGGEKLPTFTMDAIVQSANEHAREHAACTRAEVLDILRKNGASLTDYIAGLQDAELDRTGQMEIMGGEVTAEKFAELVILQSGGEHFDHMKSAVAG